VSIQTPRVCARWHLTLAPRDPAAGPAGDARAPYGGGSRCNGRIVIGNPGGAGVRAAGVDLLDVRRWELASQRCGEWLERRVCSPAERAALPRDPALRLHQFGLLFSIKESVLKAIGGIPRGARFPDITVSPPERGQVSRLVLTGATARRADALGVELVAGALPIRDGLALSWALATASPGATTARFEAASTSPGAATAASEAASTSPGSRSATRGASADASAQTGRARR
jgi:holo-[acyl-carrier protein] synthase